MAFDYNSRTRWEKERIERWEKENGKKIKKLSPEQKELLEEVKNFSSYPYCGFPAIRKWTGSAVKKDDPRPLREIIHDSFGPLIDLLVPAQFLPDFDHMLDQYAAFQYTRAIFRPTVRTKDPAAHVLDAFGLMQAYHVLAVYGVTPLEYLTEAQDTGTMSAQEWEEFLDFKRSDSYARNLHMIQFDDVLAAAIDREDPEVTGAAKEALCSDRNTVLVSVPLIRGIVKSKNTELHDLLARFLLAARLQEGARQAVCENADCGRAEAFLTILKTIEDNDLLRFSAVKRALATWTGIFHQDSAERVSEKLLRDVGTALRNPEAARKMTRTDDSMQIVTGLWALGFYEARDAVERMLEIAESGTKNQRLTISYYNRYMQHSDYSGRAAQKILETYPDDPQMAAAFMPTYLSAVDTIIRLAIRNRKDQPVYTAKEQDLVYEPVEVTELFDSRERAAQHYQILKDLADSMKKRKIEYAPLVFPWYGVTLDKSDLTQRMVLIAYALQEQDLIDEVCQRLTDIMDSYYNTRMNYLRVLLHDPRSQIQRDALIGYAADKESLTRTAAYQILKGMTLTEREYQMLEKHLRLKNEDTRRYVIELLEQQDKAGADASIRRLLCSGQEQIRLAGLDMLKRRSEKGENDKIDSAAMLHEIIPDSSGLTDKEMVLYEEIAGEEGAGSILKKGGYGLYDPAAAYQPALPKSDAKCLKKFFRLSARALDGYFDEIKKVILANGKREYTSANGDTQLLENGLFLINYDYKGAIETRYPFPELWQEIYEKIIREPEVFWNLYFAIRYGYGESDVKDVKTYEKAERTIFGDAYAGYHYTDPKYNSVRGHGIYQTILDIISSQQHLVLPEEIVRNAVLKAAELPGDVRWMERTPSRYQRVGGLANPLCFVKSNKFQPILTRACHYDSDAEFMRVFPLLYHVESVYEFEKNAPTAAYSYSSSNILSVYDYVKAYELGIIPRDFLYKAVFEMVGLRYAVGDLGELFRPAVTISAIRTLKAYLPVDEEKRTVDRESRFFGLCEELYRDLVNLILDVELRRGDTPTVFSTAVPRIRRIEGIARLMEILRAMGSDTLDRNTYYSFNTGTSKRECLSHLLKVSYPLPGETAADLKRAVKESKVKPDRLIEVAMYAPQWLEMAEEVLDIPGFTSGCYYFMAHMNERFDDRKKAVIARYTPLTPEELNNGCFDTNWFFEVYDKLGEKTFGKLYKAAKYIADGSKHTRARKYADAATGKVDRDELERTISDKRNKDLLMSYGLIPMKDRQDALHRYEFLQKFLRESKQFGAQRRQSEAQCVEYALKNMATTAGYADDLRLTLAMETELVTSNSRFLDGITIGEYEIRVTVDADGKAALVLSKKGKTVKSVPAALKKDEAFEEIKAFAAKLKSQYARCIAMFERAMEEEDAYTYGELLDLSRNPVTAGILGRIVFVQEKEITGDGTAIVGTLEELRAMDPPVSKDVRLLAAHPITLYRMGLLPRYQRMFFEKQRENGTKQPFKQVFREFYVKLEEEKDKSESRMFAGYQIQPKKTVAVLRGRRWVADYDEGLQKVFFRQNIAATIYALADWFSPADTESPTLEYVSFYDRKTYRQKKLSEIPDILYSEVMRDVDLAVSVAHVGGVDPETSHSTIEMRRVIMAFNAELFGLTNVKLEGTHAFIEGTYGNYNVHLGSGVIHGENGDMINILPVHSQHRGKIFLPFVDEDPKTAEILSKILLLAKDSRIKDPYILEQVRRG